MKNILFLFFLSILQSLPVLASKPVDVLQGADTSNAPPWSQTLTSLSDSFSGEKGHSQNPDKKIPYFEMIAYPSTAVIGGFLFWWPRKDAQSFHVEDEPILQCPEEKGGCADKFGHAFYNYMSVDLLYQHLQTSMSHQRALNYALGIDAISSIAIEIGDGFHSFGVSYGDMIANALGAAMAYYRRKWSLESHFAFKYTYKPSPRIRTIDSDFYGYEYQVQDYFQDYDNHISHFQWVPSGGFSQYKWLGWILPEVYYNARGYLPVPAASERDHKSRNLGVGISLNIPKLLEAFHAPRGLTLVFEYFQPACTTIGQHYNLDRPKDGWTELELQCGSLSFSSSF